MRAILPAPGLRRIVLAYTVTKLGTWFGIGALTLAVYNHTHSAVWVSVVMIVPLLPALLAPALVARVELSPRRGTLSVLGGAQAAAAAVLAVLLWHFWLPGILLLVALNGPVVNAIGALLRSEAARAGAGAGAITRASQSQRTRAEPPTEQQAAHSANAALNASLAVTAVAGPALAGITVERLGAAAAMCLVAAGFAVCALLMSTLDPYVEEAERSVRARLAAVRAHLQTAPKLRNLLLTQAAALVFFESGFPIEIAYAKSTLRVGESGWGVMVAVWGVGMIAGSLIFARAEGRLGRMLTAGTLAVGVAYVGFACAPSLALACVAAFVGGVGNGVQWASLLGAVQRATPERLLGRMMGAVEAIGAASPALGLCLGGAITAIASPRIAFLAMGLGACATTASFAIIGGTPGPSRANVLSHEPHGPGDRGHAHPAVSRTAGGTAQAEPVK